MKKLATILLFTLVALLSSCSMFSPEASKWGPQEEGIILHLKSDDKLNYKDGKYYTLYLVIYQLSKPNAFKQLSEDEEGLRELLESKAFDSSVTSLKNIIIYPNSDVTYKIDRATGTKYVGVVAGYRTMVKERMVRTFEIPLGTETHLLKMKREQIPDVLKVTMKFGATQIEVLKEK